MSDTSAILAAVPLRNRRILLEQNQDVADIIRSITHYHKKHVPLYDSFAFEQFDVGTERDIAKALFDFCKRHIRYVIEDETKQTIRTPARMLTEGEGDCKHYASFIAGVLDALKRAGLDLDWAYRFADYQNPWTGDITHHVFVILRLPHGKEIWIDPVLNWFDYHLPYEHAITRTIDTLSPENKMAGIGCAYDSGCSCARMGDAGSDLANYLKQYELGLYQGAQQLVNQGQMNDAAVDILKGAAASLVPGAAQALAFIPVLQQEIGQTFGVGSGFTRVLNAILSFNPLNIVKAFSGRTYNTDNYMLASDYYYHVLGIDKGPSTNVSDQEVAPALLWFIKKLGVYMSGRGQFGALRKSVDDYLNFYKIDKNTTQDRVRVQMARDVLMRYMPDINVPRNWANTVGVYDDPVTAAVERLRIQDPNAQQDTSGTVQTGLNISSVLGNKNNLLPLLLMGGGLYLFLTKN